MSNIFIKKCQFWKGGILAATLKFVKCGSNSATFFCLGTKSKNLISRHCHISRSYGKSIFFRFFGFTYLYLAWFGNGRNSSNTRPPLSSGTQKIGPVILTHQLMSTFWMLSLVTTFEMSSLNDDILNVITPYIGIRAINTRKNIWSPSDDISNVVTLWQLKKCCHPMTTHLVSSSLSD